MKKRLNLVLYLIGIVFLLNFVAADCELGVSLLNQDPYPAVPGEYVKLVFQVTGVEDSDCGEVVFELVQDYPLMFDPDESTETTIKAGTFVNDYNSYLMVPYKVRIDENALDGENPIKVKYTSASTLASITESFDLEIEDSKVDFEINIKDYDYITHILTLEILNIGEKDVEALTLEISDQESIQIKGPNRNIIGDLDSNDYTTADFEASLSEGEIKVEIFYTDSINVRRNLEKIVSFNS